jgi:prepilin-type N-terminal cleavage/methylation domain-containing protein
MRFTIFKFQKGFTIIELLLVIALIGMVSAIGISTFIGYSRAQSLQQAAADFAGTLNTAKSKAYSQVNACNSGALDGYSVITAANSYSLYIVCSGVSTRLTNPPTLTNITIAPARTVFFPVLSGGASGVAANGTSFIFSMSGLTKTVIVNTAGIITGP